MGALTRTLDNLDHFMRKRMGDVPSSKSVKLFELASARVDPTGKLSLRRTELKEVNAFESRFDEMVSLRCPWINVSCYGLVQGDLIVGIELPPLNISTTGPTSFNFSGPSRLVVENGWDATTILSIE